MKPMIESVLSRIERRVLTQPLALAIEAGNERCTYAALWARVGALSAEIEQHGLRQGDRVGVVLDRGIDWIAAFLAILKCGLVYVPINSVLPDARQRDMAQIARLRLLIAADGATSDLCPVITVPAAAASSESRPVCLLPAQALAYLIFTSGTSGVPKAVAITHSNLVAHTDAITEAYGLVAEDRVLQTCAIGFDISIEEVIPTLCAGGCLVIAPEQVGLRAGGLSAFLRDAEVTVANLPTALWSAWVDELSAQVAMPPKLRCLVVGGEACPVAKVHTWFGLEQARAVTALNGYGPTEATITTTLWPLRPRSAQSLHVPIGLPVSGTQAYVLDDAGNPAGSGELFLGGALVGQGYFEQPAATAAAFLPDPFSGLAGARMYRTGDQVHWNLDGELILTGRVDRQIKLRGYRIEPAEIERRLEMSGQVRAAVVKRVNLGEQPVLAAYIVPSADSLAGTNVVPASSTQLASVVSSLAGLPDYMHPAWYVLLPELPLNANGKVDLRSLPSLPQANATVAPAEAEFTRDDVVAVCIRQCLDRNPADWSLRFYEAGGDSIQAVRVLAALRQRGWRLDASDFLRLPMAELSTHLQAIVPAKGTASAVDPSAHGLSDHELARLRAGTMDWTDVEHLCAVTPVQLGMLYRSLTGSSEGRYVEQVEGVLDQLDVHRFQQAWREVIARHPILRATFALALPNKPLLLFRRAVAMDWQSDDWTSAGQVLEARVGAWLAADRMRGFDLITGPLQRFHLARLDEHRYHFCWTYHHALLDGWSDIDILDQVFDQYERSNKSERGEQAPARSFADYVSWLQRQDYARAIAFWQQQLRDLDPHRSWLVATPTTPEKPQVRRVEYGLDAANTARLRHAAKLAGCTLNTLLIAAWAASVSALKGCTDVVLGAIVAIRPAELSDAIVGPMLNLLPQRLTLPRQIAPWSTWLRQLQRSQTDTLEHQYLGLDQIETPDSGALFDTLFVFENYPAARHAPARALQSHTQSEFPLTVLVWPDSIIKVELLVDTTRIQLGTLERLWAGFGSALQAISDDSHLSAMSKLPEAASVECVELEI